MLKEMLRYYLIGHEEESFLCCKSNYILDALSALNLTCAREGGSLWAKVSKGYIVLLPSSGNYRVVHEMCGYTTTTKGKTK